jgi:hypothetical protein
MQIVGKIFQIIENNKPDHIKKVTINLDKIGIGVGIESRLREIIFEKGLNYKVVGCHFGEQALKIEEFSNKKAENNFRLRDLFAERLISLKNIVKNKDYFKVKQELMAIKWNITSSEKKRIIDPKKSPDFSESLVFFCWKNKSLKFDFI